MHVAVASVLFVLKQEQSSGKVARVGIRRVSFSYRKLGSERTFRRARSHAPTLYLAAMVWIVSLPCTV